MKKLINEVQRLKELAGIEELNVPDFMQGKTDEGAIKQKISEVAKMLNDVVKVLIEPPFVIDDFYASAEIKKLVETIEAAKTIIEKEIR